jgi:putative FmdB family regulatory protein
MPTYEYVCTACGHRFEAVQSFSDPALTTCPSCQGALRKVFGNVGIVLKGSGFYKTDSRKAASNGSVAKSSSSSSDASAKSDSKESSTSEKPAAAATPEKATST